MLKVTGGHWPRNVLISRVAGKDVFTVVSAVMEKDRQDAQRKKRRAHVRLAELRREVKAARPSAKPAASNAGMPLPSVPASGRRPPSPPRTAETAMEGGQRSLHGAFRGRLLGGQGRLVRCPDGVASCW
jgi:hypothetical protein